MPADLVDVNVHPTKQEVRFQDSGRLYSLLLGTLRTKFLTTDLQARGATPVATADARFGSSANSSDASELVSWAKEQLGRQAAGIQISGPIGGVTDRSTDGSWPATDREPLRLHRIDAPASLRFDIGRPPAEPGADEVSGFAAAGDSANAIAREVPAPHFDLPSNALQVHDRYLIVETEVGIEVIDQHALHERILYEQIREKVLSGSLESQRLLVPEPVDLTATEAAAALEHADVLAQLGVEIQPFGGETVLVSCYPAMLANLSPAEVLRELVEKLLAGGRQPEARDLVDELLHMIACKAAVKFGDRLTTEEVDALLAQRHLAQDQHHCPHGRPTALVFTREDLDRQFRRI
jgi:DNA mismatch repair protein MutL